VIGEDTDAYVYAGALERIFGMFGRKTADPVGALTAS